MIAFGIWDLIYQFAMANHQGENFTLIYAR